MLPTDSTTPEARFRAWLPTRPYTLIDAINRYGAATGSVIGAIASASSSYNGHSVNVYYNSYKKYWLCEHYWGERCVHARGELTICLNAGRGEWDRGARGTQVITANLTQDQLSDAIALGYQLYDEDIRKEHEKGWRDARFDQVNEAFSYQRHGLAPAVGLLANSETVEEYKAKLEKYFEERRATRNTAR